MSSTDAEGLGVDYLSGQPGSVQTAQGVADSYFVILDEVTVGSITAYNVQATVIQGGFPVDILLGMSYLRQVSMQENNGVLTLIAKH